MPNYCNYEMKIKGSKTAIKRVVNCLKAHYDYDTKEVPNNHFFRVFECVDEEEPNNNGDGTFTQYVYGYCAWSVNCAMIDKSEHSYYHHLKTEFPKLFKGTTLKEQSRNCKIEVFSEEESCEFSEHYIYEDGKCLLNDCVELIQVGYDENDNLTEDIEWENYKGYIDYQNPHRENYCESYKWTI